MRRPLVWQAEEGWGKIKSIIVYIQPRQPLPPSPFTYFSLSHSGYQKMTTTWPVCGAVSIRHQYVCDLESMCRLGWKVTSENGDGKLRQAKEEWLKKTVQWLCTHWQWEVRVRKKGMRFCEISSKSLHFLHPIWFLACNPTLNHSQLFGGIGLLKQMNLGFWTQFFTDFWGSCT